MHTILLLFFQWGLFSYWTSISFYFWQFKAFLLFTNMTSYNTVLMLVVVHRFSTTSEFIACLIQLVTFDLDTLFFSYLKLEFSLFLFFLFPLLFFYLSQQC